MKNSRMRSAVMTILLGVATVPMGIAALEGGLSKPPSFQFKAEVTTLAPVSVMKPRVITLPRLVISIPIQHVKVKAHVTHCVTHTLTQGGSPTARTVLVCG